MASDYSTKSGRQMEEESILPRNLTRGLQLGHSIGAEGAAIPKTGGRPTRKLAGYPWTSFIGWTKGDGLSGDPWGFAPPEPKTPNPGLHALSIRFSYANAGRPGLMSTRIG